MGINKKHVKYFLAGITVLLLGGIAWVLQGQRGEDISIETMIIVGEKRAIEGQGKHSDIILPLASDHTGEGLKGAGPNGLALMSADEKEVELIGVLEEVVAETEIVVGEVAEVSILLADAGTIQNAPHIGMGALGEIGLSGRHFSAGRAARHSRTSKIFSGQSEYTNEVGRSMTDNGFTNPINRALSTFSIDVDTGSYTNARQLLNGHRLPPRESVRIEEMINYFNYPHSTPAGDKPFAVDFEVATCPWNNSNSLIYIGVKGREIKKENRGNSNLVFLIDVSGSMNSENRLPLIQRGLKQLVNQLDGRDCITLVVYAGASGVVLPPTRCDNKDKINKAIDALRAGGSTNGGSGITLAYKLAMENKIDGNNRVILATDGDFNVGIVEGQALNELITAKAKSGVFLSVLGFGANRRSGNMLEQLADKGNGHYAYIDSFREIRKVLVDEMTGTLFTIAKDVKFQVEFNPDVVASYRLIGYENRRLAAKDFNDDKKDAGDVGAGHSLVAFYEIVPRHAGDGQGIDPLKYQRQVVKAKKKFFNELATIKWRYKHPNAQKSIREQYVISNKTTGFVAASTGFRFAASVAAFAMKLRKDEQGFSMAYDDIIKIAETSLGKDTKGYRSEFVDLIRKTRKL